MRVRERERADAAMKKALHRQQELQGVVQSLMARLKREVLDSKAKDRIIERYMNENENWKAEGKAFKGEIDKSGNVS